PRGRPTPAESDAVADSTWQKFMASPAIHHEKARCPRRAATGFVSSIPGDFQLLTFGVAL
ncbi:MAG TPA: hypothetical protein VFC17_03570, partial [Candidatus Limnocylindrales bacterium]|nr:hypothetical protein [Candidatus Limnocylindrales bacterium]